MTDRQAIKLRAKIIGLLLRDARLAAGKSMKELGEVIGVSSGTISAIEGGVNSPSLPELELLAFFLGTPLSNFWTAEIVSQNAHPTKVLETETFLELRHRSIGAMLRQARNERNLSQKELGQRTRISSSRIRRYENGETPVPLPELEVLAGTLGHAVEDFADTSGPIGEWITTKRAQKEFEGLPRQLKDFITNPANLPYLELAQRMSAMPLERLRAFSEGLSELVNSKD